EHDLRRRRPLLGHPDRRAEGAGRRHPRPHEVHVEAGAAGADLDCLHWPCREISNDRVSAEEHPGRRQGILAPRIRSSRHQVESIVAARRYRAELRDGPLGPRNRRRSGQEVTTPNTSCESLPAAGFRGVGQAAGDMADSINKLRVGITKRYGGKTVLDHLSLEIGGGEFVTFLGPSGCGKSTALGIIAGLVPPTEGEIWLDEQRIDDLLPEKRGFGMVFQNYALFPHLTVFGNVAFGLSLQRKPAAEIKERVGTMLGLVRLSGYEGRFSGHFSGGHQQH